VAKQSVEIRSVHRNDRRAGLPRRQSARLRPYGITREE
jgi:hypothetical protein